MAASAPDELAEASLQKRLQTQKLLVERLVSEGKDASDANATLYELSKALHDLRRKPTASSTAQ